MTQLTPHIWCNRTAEEAAEHYTRTFRQVREIARSHYPTENLPDFQQSFAGQVVSLELEIHGSPVGFINADDTFRPNPAAGFMVHISTAHVDDPTAYIDEIHDRLIDGGTALMPLGEYPFSPRYAWVEDRYGVSWQLFVSPDDAPPRPFLVPALLFSGQAQNRCAEAVVTYTSLFPGAEAGTVATYPEPTGPARAGDVMFSEMRLGPEGDDPTREPWVTAMDSGVEQPFTFTEGFSLMVRVRDQEEIDRLWDVLSTVPEKEACGWCCDEYGVSWQIVPEDIDAIMEIPGGASAHDADEEDRHRGPARGVMGRLSLRESFQFGSVESRPPDRRNASMARHPWHRLWRQMCSARLPSYRVLVPDSVNDSVLRAWEARGYDFPASRQGATKVRQLNAPGETRNLFRSSMYFRGLTGAGIATTGTVGAGTLGISALVGDLFATGAVTTGVLALATGVTGAVTGRTYLKDPKRLKKKDRESARSARWITPQSLGFVPGIKNGQDTDEQRLFHLAVVLATRIASTRAWTHPVLSDHVARVDLDDMVAGVGVRLVELVQVRLELDEMRDGTEAARVNAYLGRLAEAFESVADRVMAMHEYLEHLRALDQQLIALDHSERTRAMGERVLDIVSRTAGDDTVGAQFRDLNLEAESHAESIARLLADLDHTAEEFDDLDAQIQKAEEAGAQEGSADRPQPAALTAESDPTARIEQFLDRKRESSRNEPHER